MTTRIHQWLTFLEEVSSSIFLSLVADVPELVYAHSQAERYAARSRTKAGWDVSK
jgi:hypothetical protein